MSDTHSNTIAFVRTQDAPALPPPSNAAGPVKWLRDNLFATPANSILTILALIAIYMVLRVIVPWLANGVWDAPSLAACREILDGSTGACFAVLTERWNQLLFGFQYPTDLYWRPTLALVLLAVAAAPVLFFDLPRKLLLFTALYPFIAFWLLWGGSIGWPLLALAGCVAGFLVYRAYVTGSFAVGFFGGIATAFIVWSLGSALLGGFEYALPGFGIWKWILANLIGLGLAAWVVTFFLGRNDTQMALGVLVGLAIAVVWWIWVVPAVLGSSQHLWQSHSFAGLVGEATEGPMRSVISRYMGGFMLNMMLGVVCVSLSLPLGIALALGRQSSMPLIKYVCVVFIEFVRGVPLITLLFVANVMLGYFFPPGSGVDLFLRVVIMITMFSAAYIAEVIRGGLAALPKGQYEAADSLGLDYAQAMRLIILPQALKISIPGIVNVAVGLFKDTTLVSVISMFDLVGMIRGPILASTEWNGVYWELLGFAALLFFVVCYGISQYSQWLERRLATDHR